LGEEFFKPITRTLDQQAAQTTTEAEAEVPDYEMDYFDQFNPFDEAFQPDAPTPTPTPSPPTPRDGDEDGDGDGDEEFTFPPPPKEARKTWEEPVVTEFTKTSHESNDLANINRMMSQNAIKRRLCGEEKNIQILWLYIG